MQQDSVERSRPNANLLIPLPPARSKLLRILYFFAILVPIESWTPAHINDGSEALTHRNVAQDQPPLSHLFPHRDSCCCHKIR